MIRYVPHKPINYERVTTLLKESEKAHCFTNNGPVKQHLEHYIHQRLGLGSDKRIICTNNGTSALYILISLFEKRAQRPLSIVTTAFNFPAATVNKLNTKIVDIISPDYATIDIKDITSDIVILPTLFGTIPQNLNEIVNYCKQSNKILVLDNASSPLSKWNGLNINMYGTASIGSCHHTKYLGHNEGGFAVIPTEMYDEANYLTNFGFNDERKYDNLGTNAKMSDVSAAFILSHMESYNINSHLEVQNAYIENIKTHKNVSLFNYSDEIVFGNLPIVFSKPTSHLAFRDIGIEANKYYKPLANLPNSNYLFERIINLPLHSLLTKFDLTLIFKKIEVEAKR